MIHAAFLIATSLLAAEPKAADLKMEPVDGRRFRVEPGKAATIRWSGPPGGGPLRFVLHEYAEAGTSNGRRGAAEGSGSIAPAADGALKLARAFEAGYHEVEFPDLGRRFGLIAAPGARGKPDPFFGIDGALSWLVKDDAGREALIDEARAAGIGLVRERLTWGAVQPARDRWDWETGRRFDRLRASYRSAGVPVLEMAHDAPRWAGLDGKYPRDLVAAAESWRAIGRRWGAGWGGVEIWNEPDIDFGGDRPADQYAAYGKAVSFGLHAEGVRAPVVAGVIAQYEPDFLETLAGNGLLERAEAFSFHDYGPAVDFENKVARYREWLRKAGRPDLPLWVTECGWPWDRGPDRPSADQDRRSAREIAAKAVEARACGLERFLPFVLPYYEEKAKNFAMTDPSGSPLRSFAAYAQAVRALSGLAYLGDLKCTDPRIARARVFGDASKTVVVLFVPEPDLGRRRLGSPFARGISGTIGAFQDGSREIVLDPPVKDTDPPTIPVLRVEGADGRAIPVQAEGSFANPDGLAYAWVDRAALGDRLVTRTRAMGLHPGKPAGAATATSPIVLRYRFDPERQTPSSTGYTVKDPARTTATWTVEVHNLGEKAESLALTMQAAGAKADGQSRRVEVGPRSKADVAWDVDLAGAFGGFEAVHATVKAEGASGVLDRTEFRVAGEPKLEDALARLTNRTRLPVADLARWTSKISGGGVLRFEPLPPDGCRLDIVKHPAGDRWAYPEFRLPDGVALAGARALIVRARCAKPAQVRAFLWEGDSGVGYLTAAPFLPADGRWHVARIAFDRLVASSANAPDPNGRLDLDSVRRISLGLNHKEEANTLEVSDLYVER